jgi:uncharacterized C2H2 Zn-finger protein
MLESQKHLSQKLFQEFLRVGKMSKTFRNRKRYFDDDNYSYKEVGGRKKKALSKERKKHIKKLVDLRKNELEVLSINAD